MVAKRSGLPCLVPDSGDGFLSKHGEDGKCGHRNKARAFVCWVMALCTCAESLIFATRYWPAKTGTAHAAPGEM